MEQSPSKRLEELIRERARLDVELERCKELVTVLFVDIVGSTRFYDERGDVAGLVMVQKCLDLLIPVVETHGGIVIKTIGDAILARFRNVEDAVRSGIDMQRHLVEHNRGRAPADEIHVRVAINVGLALLKGNDVFGDVVNVAARIESATDADEIAISPSVYEKIRHLHDIPVSQKASGVELRGKLEKLDLYSVGWKPNQASGPAPPRPSKEQLSIATGLHTGLAELAQQSIAGSSNGKSEVPSPRSFDTKTAVLGSLPVEQSPKLGVRFAVARVRADGSLGEDYPLDHPGMIAGQKGEITLDDDAQVAPQHARFTQLGEGVYVEDLGSPLGVFLRLREPHRLKDGDTIQIGRQTLQFTLHAAEIAIPVAASPDRTAVLDRSATTTRRLASLARLNSKGEETDRYELRALETSFGRSKGTYPFPDDPYLSSTHAQVKLQGGQYFLEDLGSTNGTFARIRKRVLARDGDTLMIGKHLLRIVMASPRPRD
jgi:class 3 adenylate cyclase/pSer/pThr/pTyr-binding forkhead associated (FHA) protein